MLFSLGYFYVAGVKVSPTSIHNVIKDFSFHTILCIYFGIISITKHLFCVLTRWSNQNLLRLLLFVLVCLNTHHSHIATSSSAIDSHDNQFEHLFTPWEKDESPFSVSSEAQSTSNSGEQSLRMRRSQLWICQKSPRHAGLGLGGAPFVERVYISSCGEWLSSIAASAGDGDGCRKHCGCEKLKINIKLIDENLMRKRVKVKHQKEKFS